MTRRRLACVAVACLAGCTIDAPHPVPAPGTSTPVDRLSELHIFAEPLADLEPLDGVIPYDVAVPLYADGARKKRFLVLPPGDVLTLPADGASDRWQVPVGTYFVKTFYYPNDARDPDAGIHLIETRFLVKQADGYAASTYLWNADQSDAVVSGGNVDVPVDWIDERGVEHDGDFHVPGTSFCQTCHEDRALGIRTRQMDRAGSYPDGSDNQLDHLMALGVLDRRPPSGVVLVDPTGDQPIEDRARSYLDANCSHCHAEQGFASNTGLYFDYEHTGPADLPICRHVNAIEGRNHVIVPGRPDESEFLVRMQSSDPFARMPLGPVRVPDDGGIAMLSQWVAAMTPAGCP